MTLWVCLFMWCGALPKSLLQISLIQEQVLTPFDPTVYFVYSQSHVKSHLAPYN